VRHRSDAQKLIEAGHARLNRQRVEKLSQPVKPGDVLTLTLYSGVKVLKVAAEPIRRGSAPQARDLYEIIDTASQKEGATPAAIC
jgi:ribosome-associated heat shock protein Hsp15